MRSMNNKALGFTLIEVVVVVALLLMVGGGVYIWQQSQLQDSLVDQQEGDSSPQSSISPTPTPINIPSDWVEYESNMCEVRLAIPPKKAPYIEKSEMHGDAYWDVQEGILDSMSPFSHAYVGARFSFAPGTPTGAGDSVGISCSEEMDQPVKLEDFKQEYVEWFEQNPPSADLFEDGQSSTVIGKISSIEEVTVGNMPAIRVEVPDFNQGINETRFEYLVAANNRQYIVTASEVGWPGDDTVHKIFEYIQF